MTARSKFVFDLNGTLMLAGMYAAMDMGLSLSAYGLSTMMPSKGTLLTLILFKLILLATTILKGSLLIASLMCSKKDIKR